MSEIENIITDTGGYTAKYIPIPIELKPVEGCSLPPPVESTLIAPTIPTLQNFLDCDLNFIPDPIIAPPHIPSLEGPCPSGFNFEAQFTPSEGQYIKQLSPSGGVRPIQLFNFNTGAAGLNTSTEDILPQLQIYLTIAPDGQESGANLFPIVVDQRYTVVVEDYNPATMSNKGIWYNSTFYRHGQTFKGLAGIPQAVTSGAADNEIVSLTSSQRRRIVDYDRSGQGTVYLSEGFVLPSSGYEIHNFVFNRLVFDADSNKETGGNIRFDQNPCGGRLLGEINLNIGDLNIPCEEGFSFDAGYSPVVGQALTITNTDTVGADSIDLVSLVPTGISPDTGWPYPMPTLRIKTGEDTWQQAKVLSVNLNNTWTLATPLPNGTYTTWYLQRINVTIGSPTGGQFEFIRSGSCGGRLVGQIEIDAPEFNTPCETALQNDTLVIGGGGALQHVDRLRSTTTNTPSVWQPVTPSVQNILVDVDNDNSCQYRLGFTSNTGLGLPNIRVQMNLNNQLIPFNRIYDPVGDVVTFSATINQGTTVGGGSDAERCLNCCRWS